jgi:uncharacterized protein YceK
MAITSALKTGLLLGAAAAILSGCASFNKVTEAKDAPKGERAGLSAQTLGAGDCGTFVWTADAQRRFILFSQTDKNYALWDGPGGKTRLTHLSSAGARTQNQYPQQSYEGVRLDLREPQPIENGTRYQGGTLTETQDREWTRVTPVVGVTVCKPNA